MDAANFPTGGITRVDVEDKPDAGWAGLLFGSKTCGTCVKVTDFVLDSVIDAGGVDVEDELGCRRPPLGKDELEEDRTGVLVGRVDSNG